MKLQSLTSNKISIELLTIIYALTYLPYVMIIRHIGTMQTTDLGRPLTGLEILPGMLIAGMVFTFIFIYWSGWYKDALQMKIGPVTMPWADRWTLASGICTAVILVSVPLSYTFKDVSIPFMQLLMRGDVLIIAPLVDIVSGRRVRWWSWVALVLVGLGLFITLFDRGGLNLPPLALGIVVIYTMAYFARLFIMSKVSKNDDPKMVRRFFTEEKTTSMPLAILFLAVLPFLLGGNGAGASSSDSLKWGFFQVWSSVQMPFIIGSGIMIAIMGVLALLILLDKRENSYCVPLERSASILAGIGASIILALWFGGVMPNGAEFIGASLLIVAMIVLSIGPRLEAKAEMRKLTE